MEQKPDQYELRFRAMVLVNQSDVYLTSPTHIPLDKTLALTWQSRLRESGAFALAEEHEGGWRVRISPRKGYREKASVLYGGVHGDQR